MTDEETLALLEDVVCVGCDSYGELALELEDGTVVEYPAPVRDATTVSQCPDCEEVICRAW